VWGEDEEAACSYCGSISPERLLEILDGGGTVVPTDKNYKLYVRGLPGRDEHSHIKFYTHHFLLDTERAVEFRRRVLDHEVKIGYPGYFYSKLWLPIDKPSDGRD
jgi:hypothetical protein